MLNNYSSLDPRTANLTDYTFAEFAKNISLTSYRIHEGLKGAGTFWKSRAFQFIGRNLAPFSHKIFGPGQAYTLI